MKMKSRKWRWRVENKEQKMKMKSRKWRWRAENEDEEQKIKMKSRKWRWRAENEDEKQKMRRSRKWRWRAENEDEEQKMRRNRKWGTEIEKGRDNEVKTANQLITTIQATCWWAGVAKRTCQWLPRRRWCHSQSLCCIGDSLWRRRYNAPCRGWSNDLSVKIIITVMPQPYEHFKRQKK